MGTFKVKKTISKTEGVSIDNWLTQHFCIYFRERFVKTYGFETRRTEGQLKCHINQATISKVLRMEGRSIDIHPNELYKDYIDWLFKTVTASGFRTDLLSNEESVSQFLDNRARERIEGKMGSFDEFEKIQKARIKQAEQFFGGVDIKGNQKSDGEKESKI